MKILKVIYLSLITGFGILLDILTQTGYPVLAVAFLAFGMSVMEVSKTPKRFFSYIGLRGVPIHPMEEYPDKRLISDLIRNASFSNGITNFEIVWMDYDWMNAFSIQKVDGSHMFFVSEGLVERLTKKELNFCAYWLVYNAKTRAAFHLYKSVISHPEVLIQNTFVAGFIATMLYIPIQLFKRLLKLKRTDLDTQAETAAGGSFGFSTLCKIQVDFALNNYAFYPDTIEEFALFSQKDIGQRIKALVPKSDDENNMTAA